MTLNEYDLLHKILSIFQNAVFLGKYVWRLLQTYIVDCCCYNISSRLTTQLTLTCQEISYCVFLWKAKVRKIHLPDIWCQCLITVLYLDIWCQCLLHVLYLDI